MPKEEDEIIHLYVYICSDGTLMSYNKDKTLNTTFTDLVSWGRLKEICAFQNLPSIKRKGLAKAYNIKYVKYYFKNTKDDTIVEIPSEHIKNITANIIGGGD